MGSEIIFALFDGDMHQFLDRGEPPPEVARSGTDVEDDSPSAFASFLPRPRVVRLESNFPGRNSDIVIAPMESATAFKEIGIIPASPSKNPIRSGASSVRKTVFSKFVTVGIIPLHPRRAGPGSGPADISVCR